MQENHTEKKNEEQKEAADNDKQGVTKPSEPIQIKDEEKKHEISNAGDDIKKKELNKNENNEKVTNSPLTLNKSEEKNKKEESINENEKIDKDKEDTKEDKEDTKEDKEDIKEDKEDIKEDKEDIKEDKEDAKDKEKSVSGGKSDEPSRDVDPVQRKKAEAMLELYWSGNKYIEDLKTWDNVRKFILNMNFLPLKKKYRLCEVVFINLDKIIFMHEQIRSEIKRRVRECYKKVGIDRDIIKPTIPEPIANLSLHDLYIEHMKGMQEYIYYAKRLPKAEFELEKEKKSNYAFREEINKYFVENNIEEFGARHFMYRPSQKFPRYVMLFKALKKREINEDFKSGIDKVLEEIGKIAKAADKAFGDSNNNLKVYKLSKEIKYAIEPKFQLSLNLISKSRSFIREGKVFMQNNYINDPKEVHCILLDNVLIFCDITKDGSKNIICPPLFLLNYIVMNKNIGSVPESTQLQDLHPLFLLEKGGLNITSIFFQEMSIRDHYFQDIKSTIENLNSKINKKIQLYKISELTPNNKAVYWCTTPKDPQKKAIIPKKDELIKRRVGTTFFIPNKDNTPLENKAMEKERGKNISIGVLAKNLEKETSQKKHEDINKPNDKLDENPIVLKKPLKLANPIEPHKNNTSNTSIDKNTPISINKIEEKSEDNRNDGKVVLEDGNRNDGKVVLDGNDKSNSNEKDGNDKADGNDKSISNKLYCKVDDNNMIWGKEPINININKIIENVPVPTPIKERSGMEKSSIFRRLFYSERDIGIRKSFIRNKTDNRKIINSEDFMMVSTEDGTFIKSKSEFRKISDLVADKIFYDAVGNMVVILSEGCLFASDFVPSQSSIDPILITDEISNFFYGYTLKKRIIATVKSFEMESSVFLYEIKEHDELYNIDIYRRLQIKSEISDICFLSSKMVIACKDFEIVDSDTLRTQELLNPLDYILPHYFDLIDSSFAHSFHIINTENFLVCYDKIGFIVNSHGQSGNIHTVLAWTSPPNFVSIFKKNVLCITKNEIMVYDILSSNILFYERQNNFKVLEKTTDGIFLYDKKYQYKITL